MEKERKESLVKDVSESLIRKARNEYQRDYYKKKENKEKRKEYNKRYWAKRVSKRGEKDEI